MCSDLLFHLIVATINLGGGAVPELWSCAALGCSSCLTQGPNANCPSQGISQIPRGSLGSHCLSSWFQMAFFPFPSCVFLYQLCSRSCVIAAHGGSLGLEECRGSGEGTDCNLLFPFTYPNLHHSLETTEPRHEGSSCSCCCSRRSGCLGMEFLPCAGSWGSRSSPGCAGAARKCNPQWKNVTVEMVMT